MEDGPEFAAIILFDKDGRLILQLRDDIPGIVDPGKLSLFAGRLLSTETPLQGAIRELYEETHLKLDEHDLRYVFPFEKDQARHGGRGTSHVFLAPPVDLAKVEVQEGQGYRLVDDFDTTDEQDYARISYDILKRYFETI